MRPAQPKPRRVVSIPAAGGSRTVSMRIHCTASGPARPGLHNGGSDRRSPAGGVPPNSRHAPASSATRPHPARACRAAARPPSPGRPRPLRELARFLFRQPARDLRGDAAAGRCRTGRCGSHAAPQPDLPPELPTVARDARPISSASAGAGFVVTNGNMPGYFRKRPAHHLPADVARDAAQAHRLRHRAPGVHRQPAVPAPAPPRRRAMGPPRLPQPLQHAGLPPSVRYDGKIIETGYPRNDILSAPEARARSATRVRAQLGHRRRRRGRALRADLERRRSVRARARPRARSPSSSATDTSCSCARPQRGRAIGAEGPPIPASWTSRSIGTSASSTSPPTSW